VSRIELIPNTRASVLRKIDELDTDARREVSPVWLTAVYAADEDDPWMFGFAIRERATGDTVGTCGFKSPPVDGVVEIAYGVNPDKQGRGFATEAAGALVAFALESERVTLVCAHTFAAHNASTRVLQKNGFHLVGPVIDPEDGEVWRWAKPRA
jgi:RimJ/RimL family protein N-acetyltransferase